ncbi:hypothetical protein [Paraburkholderia sp. ZP32-5]|uniref:hypothetical protein n=1 Tax=Paraburkholderia sp. ZP32-5 TaxID=2883245 RepID=UPI001F3AA55F|nr:hypothetical protein [Paraburkholderia sp. ZP32-5]
MTSTQAVFLHTGYRTAGTWLWSCFRALDGVLAYYEPLHEMLASIDAATLASSTSNSWRSGHPRLDAPYFAEFADLIESGGRGIAGFDAAFSIDRFADAKPEHAAGIEQYLRMLIARASERQRVPVFKFCRSLGRLAWFRETFPDVVHVVVAKSPLLQWQSCWDLFALHRNAHFVALPFMVLALNRRVPLVEQVLASLQIVLPRELQSIDELTIDGCLAVCKAHVSRITPAEAYRAFVGYWLLTLRHAVTHADAVFDCDLAMGSRAYLSAVEDWIARTTGLTPSLRSARSGGAAGRRCALGVTEGAAIHVAAIECGRTLVRDAGVPAEALSLWTNKLVEATLSLSTDANESSAQSRMRDKAAMRIVDLTVAESFGRDAVTASGLATTRAALGIAAQRGDGQGSMFGTLASSTRRLFRIP